MVHPDQEGVEKLHFKLEKSNLHKNGNLVTIETCGTPVFRDEGFCGRSGIVRNTAERGELEDRFLHSQGMESVGQLACGIANDINNILTAVIGYEQLLISRLEDDPKGKYYAEKVLELAWKMSGLTYNLIVFSRIQTACPGMTACH
jgi:nitrogen-specific signal transduction histidine kinase